MGKKGTKRKTKWRALPLGEEAGGSGNEEDLLDEDQSTTSSVIGGVGGQPASNTIKGKPFYYKMADKPFRQTRRFTHDRFRGKEPLVKLESKTFDEEEYTKITTPRQDVLFKKGYFGRKRESSLEESAPLTGEMDGEEPVMDQIIITNGFVDERGHYLVNGNSYEIYDPYSNTVTVVVGPPPYGNGVTQPVLAAVSCQPVPLQPVDWYPPAADWPSQGSAWTPSYPRPPTHPDPLPSPDAPPAFTAPPPEPHLPPLYSQPAFVVPGYGYTESPLYNGVAPHANPPTEAQPTEENMLEVKKTRRKSTESVEEEGKTEPRLINTGEETRELTKSPIIAQDISENAAIPPPVTPTDMMESKQIEKQSHSTQTNPSKAGPRPRTTPPGKESHSTQTPPEDAFQSSKTESKPLEKSNKTRSEILISSLGKSEVETNPTWKLQSGRYANSVKKFCEDSPRKVSQTRGNHPEDRRLPEMPESSPVKVSYAKKTMLGLENGSPKLSVNGTSGRMMNGSMKSPPPLVDSCWTGRANGVKPTLGHEEKRNGFARPRYNRGKTTPDRTSRKYKEKREEQKFFKDPEKKCEEPTVESRSQSEKSSTVSELSSPTELSSGQNTPPEKLIVQKMEEEINKSFEEKLKQNLSKAEEKEEEEKKEEKSEDRPKGKKKKNKTKIEAEKGKETGRVNKKKKKKKRGEEEETKKFESDNSSEEIPFLTSMREKEVLFGNWEELKMEMGTYLDGDREILRSLGLSEDRLSHSKLPLHSDLLMMLPAFGWSRPKLKIEDFFAPAPYQSDLFIERNITSMKSTKPEEFFASVVDSPVGDKSEKKKEAPKKASPKAEDTSPAAKKSSAKSGNKANSGGGKKGNQTEVEEEEEEERETKEETEGKAELEVREGKLGIVEAVNTWLQEQGESEGFATGGKFESLSGKEDKEEEETNQKNGEGNPIHARCHRGEKEGAGEFREGGGCIRVANVINDGFIHVSGEFPGKKKSRRMYRSSSWDAKLSEVNIKKHFKFLTDSASFCQDLISDVRNGLPAGNEYATEELCDPQQTVTKYYILAPNGRLRSESDSENEVFDALEYKFLSKESHESNGKSPDGNGNVSITDSGVHSDMESSEDNATEQQQKEAACKLQ